MNSISTFQTCQRSQIPVKNPSAPPALLVGCSLGKAPEHHCLDFRGLPLVVDCPVTWVNHKSPNMTCSLWTWPYPENTFLWQCVCDMMTGYDYDLYSHKFCKEENQHICLDEMTCGRAKGAHSSWSKIIQNTVFDVDGPASWLFPRESTWTSLPGFLGASSGGWLSCDVGQPQVSKHDMFFVNLALSRQYVSLTMCMWHDGRIWLRFVQSQIL